MPYRFSYGALPSELEELTILLEDDLLLGTSNISADVLRKIKLSTLLGYLEDNLPLKITNVPVYLAILEKTPRVLWDFSKYPFVVDYGPLHFSFSSLSTTSIPTQAGSLINGTTGSHSFETSYLTISNPILDLRNNWTIETVISLTAYNGTLQGIISCDISTNYQYRLYISGVVSEPRIYIQTQQSNTAYYCSQINPMIFNTVYHVTAVRKDAELSLYINGELQQTVAVPNTVWTQTVTANRFLFVDPSGVTTRRFSGKVAYIALYDIALSQEQIESHYELAL
jgi:hypothetical protein